VSFFESGVRHRGVGENPTFNTQRRTSNRPGGD
jgi:hypothetical protein